jgi:predicted ATPase
VDAAYEANVKVVVVPDKPVSIDDLFCDIMSLCDSQTAEASILKGFNEVNVLGLEDIRASRRKPAVGSLQDPWDRYDSIQQAKAPSDSSVVHPNFGGCEEAMDDGVQGVERAALGSLQESGFAAKRALSRLKEMQTDRYLRAHLARRTGTEAIQV